MEKEPKVPPKQELTNEDVAGGFDVDNPKAREAMDKLLGDKKKDFKKNNTQH